MPLAMATAAVPVVIPWWVLALAAGGLLLFALALALIIRLTLRKPGPRR